MKCRGTSAIRRSVFLFLALAAVLPQAAGAVAARQPVALPEVGDSFEAPFDAVWDATLRNLGVLKILVADKAAGRIETEPFPFAFVVGSRPAPARLAALGPAPLRLAQDGTDSRATQVVWIALHISVARAGERRTDVRVVPYLHDALLTLFTPGPTNNPWTDLFAKLRSTLGLR